MPKPLRISPPDSASTVGLVAPRTTGRHRFSVTDKQRILQAAAACAHGELGASLRREGIYHSQLQDWRAQRAKSGVQGLQPQRPVPKHDAKDRQIFVLSSRVKKLERELVIVNSAIVDTHFLVTRGPGDVAQLTVIVDTRAVAYCRGSAGHILVWGYPRLPSRLWVSTIVLGVQDRAQDCGCPKPCKAVQGRVQDRGCSSLWVSKAVCSEQGASPRAGTCVALAWPRRCSGSQDDARILSTRGSFAAADTANSSSAGSTAAVSRDPRVLPVPLNLGTPAAA